MGFFFFIHSFACIMPGRCSSAGLLPRQHQDPHDCAVWVLASYGSREQELFSIIYCCTKLFVCFFNFQTRQNAEERKKFSCLSVKVVKGHTVVSRAESNNEIKTLYKPPVKKLLRNEKSATSIFGVEIALCNLK